MSCERTAADVLRAADPGDVEGVAVLVEGRIARDDETLVGVVAVVTTRAGREADVVPG